MMSQWLQGQEANLQQMNQLQQRTRQALLSDPEMSAFADVKDEMTLNEW